jgi:molybdopterin-containing oxidoreductase family iron-sulfur binding subunit
MTIKPLEPAAKSGENQGREFWRSLEELAETPSFQEWLSREFPPGASEMRDPASRRRFLKLMGASLALASLTGCQFAIKPPPRTIVPYVRQPELVIPGRALFYATGYVQHGYATGVLAESHEGRPTKIEGNPDHPSSLGATDRFAQAAVLTMYDPDRSQGVLKGGQPSTWQEFTTTALAALEQQKANEGANVRVLTETITSPTLALDIRKLLRAFPQAQWVQYEPLNRDGATAGAELAFGTPLHPVYDFSKADVVFSLDADFTAEGVGSVRYARDFSERRKVRKEKHEMNRLYMVEPTPSPTGSIADHRLPVRASHVDAVARAVAKALGVAGVADGAALSEKEATFVAALVKDLQAHSGKSLVIVGDHQPALVHALGYAINHALGNIGTTVSFVEPIDANTGNQLAGITRLAQEMAAGQVQVLLILGGNPAYTAPADLNFAGALASVPLSIHHSLYVDETSSAATWHINATHFLEEWGDARAHDGTATIIQPLIAPIYGGKSASDVVNTLIGSDGLAGYPAMINYWKGVGLGDDFDKAWFEVLRSGVVPNSAATPVEVTLNTAFASQAAPTTGDLEVVFRPDPSVGDGTFSNNGWMQELPKPITKLTWDNAAYISPATAKELGVVSTDVLTLTVGGAAVEVPVILVPGQADKTITVHYGYGRSKAGRVAALSPGFNAYALRTTASPYFAAASVAKAGKTHKLASTQLHFQLEGRKKDIVPSGTHAEFLADEEFLHKSGEKHEVLSLYPPYEYTGYAWGMSIDLNVCTGCNACVVACQSENNISIVGKDEVLLGRELQWIRVDQYFVGDEENPEVYTQPMMCQHCELAPCELVCPVAATQHDSEGLNVMTYNRCVGTKYCSNNCPYKVRRYNFLNYLDVPYRSPIDATTENNRIPVLKLMRNPDVTVRTRGVMEKCTYCIQRINEARIDARREDRQIQDGEVVTACQQVCPMGAITFGNINDPNAAVTRLKAEPLTYTVLDKLNPKPRTSYMARLRNLNPELGGGETKTE